MIFHPKINPIDLHLTQEAVTRMIEINDFTLISNLTAGGFHRHI